MAKSRNFLIDTEVFIWGMEVGKKLSPQIRSILEDPTQNIFISVVSVWEIVIKKAKGRLKTPENIEQSIQETGFKVIPIEISHVLGIEKLPIQPDHKDPFDRILISQAKVENLTLVTSDPKIWKYNIDILKC